MTQSSDPFVAIVFEDTMVRTKVLFNTLSPRWMPWSTRAFALNISHPGSICFLGVFDYDEDLAVATVNHDPIGRVVLNTINFESSVTYVLQYDLVDSSQIDKVRKPLISLPVKT
jgi:C2 domain